MNINKFIALTLSWTIALQPVLLQAAPQNSSEASPGTNSAMQMSAIEAERQPRELSGFLDDRRDEYRAAQMAEHDAAFGEDGSPATKPPLADLPVIDSKLMEKAARVESDEELRLIVHLAYLPHTAVLEATLQQHAAAVEQLELRRLAHLDRVETRRDPRVKIDALDYASVRVTSAAEKQELREIAEQNEALSLRIKEDVTTELKHLIEPSQSSAAAAIEKLGGTVEFKMIAGNTLVVTLPAHAVTELATVPGVMRVVEDSMLHGHLTTADNSTMVDPVDASLTGLWDDSYDGGIYDPAVIDSGTDLAHPALADTGTRSNWCSWYLVAANGSSSFDDQFTCDDLQGHGTHVYGIVGSYGSTGFTSHLGMSYGVEKMVSLKAGWLNSTNGQSSMFWSDKYNLVERALFNTGQLAGPADYADDVEGFNLSYGGDTTLDDTDGGRFWDSIVSSISDVAVTISAGNSGPSNTIFSDPAVSYNAITVANANDRGTTSRTDDIINPSSTVGPTASSRRKPDIAAPGTSIAAPNHAWEGAGSDFVNKTGTSMAAPMVLGVLMDLMDAGVFDELTLKALLINTAQKNLPGMNIESDTDGWDEAIGWGMMNAHAAYFHRFDTFVDSVTPRETAGDFQLYKGTMQDEGAAGEGRDRATMVWNRVATYNTAATPTTYYNLPDINLRLYRESDEVLIDSDFDANDNVHQVRIGPGAGETDVIVNAYAWSTAFDHGGATQTYVLATEENFTRVDHPSTFQGVALWPTSVEPNEVFDVTFWLRNDSEIASHDNIFNLELPAGWTLIAGTDTQNVGSAQGGGGITAQITYTLRAPTTATGASTLVVAHSHNSYNEPYGDFNWNMGVNVEVDNTPPNPNPMSFFTLPFNVSTESISMTASFASDIHDPVEYYIDYVNSPTFSSGGTDSGWQESQIHTDLALSANGKYCYQAWARDNAQGNNQTNPSPIFCTYTSQNAPLGVFAGSITTTSMTATATGNFANPTSENSGVQIRNTTNSTDSGFTQSFLWGINGLTPATGYTLDAIARNGDGDLTSASPATVAYTLANPPAVDVLLTVSDSEIKVALNSNGNGSEAEYLIQNTTAGTDSGWINLTSYSFEGLTCETFYNFQARSRNGDGIESIIVPLGLQTTAACAADADNDGVLDSMDNCTLVINPTQLDTNGDGYGNACDPDLDNNGVVNFIDIGLFSNEFGLAGPNDADHDGSGVVNFLDYAIYPNYIFGPPGPSGVAP